MSKWLADEVGLVEGEKAIYTYETGIEAYLRAATVMKVFDDGLWHIKVKCEEFEEYVYPRDLYTKEKIMTMFGE